MKKMLLVFAHPDDESFTTAGTVAKYVKAGWHVDLICATKGEAGMSGPYGDDVDVSQLRQKELEAASNIVGVSSITYLGYKDGTLSDIHPGDLEETILKKIFEFTPDVIITFEPNGISNHPDHIKISLSTTYAFQKYARSVAAGPVLGSRDPRRYLLNQAQEAEARNEPKLYYACVPQSVSEYLIKKKTVPAESFGKPWRGVEDKTVTTVIDISKYARKKADALKQHITQTSDVERFFSLPNHPLLSQEYFILRMQGEQEVFMGNNDRVSNKL